MVAVFKAIDSDRKAWNPWSYDYVLGVDVPFSVNPRYTHNRPYPHPPPPRSTR
jgi:hypothetical protein